jgi:arylsulfatase A-like enzyme
MPRPPLSARTRRLGVLAVLACAAACDGRDAHVARGPVRTVVVICIDTLRADAVATVPGRPPAMPALEAFARTGTAFSDASSSAAWTAPAVATLLTGLEPSQSGVRGPVSTDRLVPSVTTLAGRLQAAGWSTWGFTGGAIVTPDRGLSNGFDEFSIRFDDDGPEACVERWRRSVPRDAPKFLFLHTYAAHDPYGPKDANAAEPPRTELAVSRGEAFLHEASGDGGRLSRDAILWFLDSFLTDPPARRAFFRRVGDARALRAWQQVLDWIDGPGHGSPELLAAGARLKAAYRDGLPSADRVFARTLAALEKAGVGSDAAVIVLGDHGEAFGEHGTVSHGRWLYDELTRIPLFVRAPGRFPAGVRVRGACGLVDVTPTVLDLAGLPAAAELDGTTLRSLAAGETSGRPVLAEEERFEKDGMYVALRTTSVRVPAAKYLVTVNVRTGAVVREELYDLLRDPGETASLPVGAVATFGGDFCAAVHRIRSALPGIDAGIACAPAAAD